MNTWYPDSLALFRSSSMFSTVLLATTFSPTRPQMTPSGLRKSFYGSVITSAVSLGDEFMLILSCWTGALPASPFEQAAGIVLPDLTHSRQLGEL